MIKSLEDSKKGKVKKTKAPKRDKRPVTPKSELKQAKRPVTPKSELEQAKRPVITEPESITVEKRLKQQTYPKSQMSLFGVLGDATLTGRATTLREHLNNLKILADMSDGTDEDEDLAPFLYRAPKLEEQQVAMNTEPVPQQLFIEEGRNAMRLEIL